MNDEMRKSAKKPANTLGGIGGSWLLGSVDYPEDNVIEHVYHAPEHMKAVEVMSRNAPGKVVRKHDHGAASIPADGPSRGWGETKLGELMNEHEGKKHVHLVFTNRDAAQNHLDVMRDTQANTRTLGKSIAHATRNDGSAREFKSASDAIRALLPKGASWRSTSGGADKYTHHHSVTGSDPKATGESVKQALNAYGGQAEATHGNGSSTVTWKDGAHTHNIIVRGMRAKGLAKSVDADKWMGAAARSGAMRSYTKAKYAYSEKIGKSEVHHLVSGDPRASADALHSRYSGDGADPLVTVSHNNRASVVKDVRAGAAPQEYHFHRDFSKSLGGDMELAKAFTSDNHLADAASSAIAKITGAKHMESKHVGNYSFEHSYTTKDPERSGNQLKAFFGGAASTHPRMDGLMNTVRISGPNGETHAYIFHSTGSIHKSLGGDMGLSKSTSDNRKWFDEDRVAEVTDALEVMNDPQRGSDRHFEYRTGNPKKSANKLVKHAKENGAEGASAFEGRGPDAYKVQYFTAGGKQSHTHHFFKSLGDVMEQDFELRDAIAKSVLDQIPTRPFGRESTAGKLVLLKSLTDAHRVEAHGAGGIVAAYGYLVDSLRSERMPWDEETELKKSVADMSCLDEREILLVQHIQALDDEGAEALVKSFADEHFPETDDSDAEAGEDYDADFWGDEDIAEDEE